MATRHNPNKPQPNTVDTKQALELLGRAYAAPPDLTGVVLTFTQHAALWMYDVLNLNVLPQLYGQKKSHIPWGRAQYTRLTRTMLLQAFQGRCNLMVLVGRTSENLFDLDSEDVETHKWVKACLHERNIPIWAYRTSRGGHHWLKCADGVVKSIATDIKKAGLNLEVRGHTGYVIAPPSVNAETGAIYDWEERDGDAIPVVSLAQIDFLPIALELVHKTVKKPSNRVFTRFWNSTHDYLQTGHLLNEGQRHTHFFNATVDYARNNLTRADIERDLVPVAQRSGLPDDGDSLMFDRVISWALDNAYKWSVKSRRIFDWQRAEAFINRHHWQGRTGNTDRAVAVALIDSAKSFSNSNGTFRASYRELGQAARVSNRQTLHKALERLKAIPFVMWAGADRLSGANLWRFSDKVLHTTAETFGTSDQIQTDALERGALGQNGVRVWQALLSLDKPAKPAQIVLETGLTTKQVAYVLRPDGWARKSGLVKQAINGTGWIGIPATAEQLDEAIARPAGKLGKSKDRKQKSTNERAKNITKFLIKWRIDNDSDNFNV